MPAAAHERHQRVMAAFCEACDLDPPSRELFLASFAQAEPELVEELRALLVADREPAAEGLEEGGGLAALLARDLTHTLNGQAALQKQPMPGRVGSFVIKRQLGAGGMGVVYEAEQERPRRLVALKLLHPQMISERSAGRFELEAEALAQIEHPGIPSVFEIGEHEGLHYIAMEMVSGPSLTEHACQSRLPIHEVVSLAIQIADAVQHAHLRGYVHRDLKPDNVRLGDDGRPRVLDFGIAQALGRQHGASGPGEVAGTLAYMAPEQFDPKAAPDIRTDVYALGCMLHQMLTGRLPHDLSELTLAQSIMRIKAGVSSELPLNDGCASDLAAIVRRALCREPHERYASAGELAEDLRRYARGEAVLAYAGGAGYRFAKLVGQYRVLAVSLLALFVVISTAAAVSFVLYRRAEDALAASVAAQDKAEAESKKARATAEFLSKMIVEAKPVRSVDRELTIRDAVHRASEMLSSKEVKTDPEVQAALHVTLAEAYAALGDVAEARRQVESVKAMVRAKQPVAPRDHVAVLLRSAELHNLAGQVDEALAESERASELLPQINDETSARLLRAEAQHETARVLRDAGRRKEALAKFGQALTARRALAEEGLVERTTIIGTLNQMGHLLAYMGDYDAAEANYNESLEICEALFGDSHPRVANTLHNLAWLATKRGEHEKALTILDRALPMRLKGLGPDHPALGNQRVLRASILMTLGRLDEADEVLTDALRIMSAAHGPKHARVLNNRLARVDLRTKQGRTREAVVLGQRLLKECEEVFGLEHQATGEAMVTLARALDADGRQHDALAMAQAGRTLGVKKFGPTASLVRQADRVLQRVCPKVGASPHCRDRKTAVP